MQDLEPQLNSLNISFNEDSSYWNQQRDCNAKSSWYISIYINNLRYTKRDHLKSRIYKIYQQTFWLEL